MSSTVLNNLPAALLVVGALVALGVRLRSSAAQRPGLPDAELVRVGGQVISQHRFTLR